MKLHLGLESHEEITEHEFKTIADLLQLIIDVTKDNMVYVFAIDGKEDGLEQELVIVQERAYLTKLVWLLLNEMTTSSELVKEYENFYLQEYPSFEEAYSVALSMQENSPFCYSPENDD